MIEKLGPRKFVLPAVVVLLVGAVMALMFTPLVKMTPKDLPFAVLSPDQGVSTPDGEVNGGKLMLDRMEAMQGSAASRSPVQWHVVETQEELDAALERNEYFGALTIPADFTETQVRAEAGEDVTPTVKVVLDNARSPLIATQMQGLMGTMFEPLGIGADIELIHTGHARTTSASPLAGMMTQQLSVIPLMTMSMVSAILLTLILPKGLPATAGGRFRTLGMQFAYAAGLSLLASLTTLWLLNGLVGASTPFWTTALFLWFSSFAVMSLFLGAFDVSKILGVLAVFFAFLFGVMTAALPPEVLPSFWANWIVPWVPQPFIAQGVRDILYMGAELMPRGSGGLLAITAGGMALAAASAFLPGRGQATGAESEQAEGALQS